MGYYEINIVSENWTYGGFTTSTTFKYFSVDLSKKDIDYVWHYISNNRLMAAKQKIELRNCTILGKGKQVWASYGSNEEAPGNSFKKFCLMFKPEDKLIQMSLTTARDRAITVSIAHRKWD